MRWISCVGRSYRGSIARIGVGLVQPAVGRLHDAAPTRQDVLRGLADDHVPQSVRPQVVDA